MIGFDISDISNTDVGISFGFQKYRDIGYPFRLYDCTIILCVRHNATSPALGVTACQCAVIEKKIFISLIHSYLIFIDYSLLLFIHRYLIFIVHSY